MSYRSTCLSIDVKCSHTAQSSWTLLIKEVAGRHKRHRQIIGCLGLLNKIPTGHFPVFVLLWYGNIRGLPYSSWSSGVFPFSFFREIRGIRGLRPRILRSICQLPLLVLPHLRPLGTSVGGCICATASYDMR